MSSDTTTAAVAPDVERARQVLIEAFGRAGTLFVGNNLGTIPGLLDDELAEIADKAAGSWEEGLRGRDGTSLAACDHLLTMVRALRVLCGFEPTPQACDVIETIRAKDAASAQQYIAEAHWCCPGCGAPTVPAFLINGFDPNVGIWTRFDTEPSGDGTHQLVAPCTDTGGKLVAMSPNEHKPMYAVHTCKEAKGE